ncbi:unnamed protein product [Peronospora destructor]|uniref:Uncharacterized protein n=1 Tax=Peronospora destructor TaxID=86335 RepID=A0AAV0V364_9STRA|nr:unnamed protein product [Peronospora destructor]
MYHGTIQDRKDKRRRLTPPPNEVWMEAILSKGKTSDGYIPTTALTSSEMTTTAPLSAPNWHGRGTFQTSMKSQQTLIQYPQQYSTGYEGTSTLVSHVQVTTRAGERSTLYQGRVSKNSIEQGQGRASMDVVTPYQG